MNAEMRFPEALFTELHADLSRPHAFASERVSFLSCCPARLPGCSLLFVGQALHPVDDDDYEEDGSAGAVLGPNAVRKALQYAYSTRVSIFTVHRHEHRGQPQLSRVDMETSERLVTDLWNARPDRPHGAVVLSQDSAFGLLWCYGSRRLVAIQRFAIVGWPIREVGYGVV